MVRPRTSPEAIPILQLLSDYSFDVDACAAEAMVTGWLQQFEPTWVSQAITEALYQGRYKMVSVDHILQIWQRRGQPLRHFNREFESIILGQSWGQFLASTKANAASSSAAPESLSGFFTTDAKAASAPQHHTNAVAIQDNGHPFSTSLFGAGPSPTDRASTHDPFDLSATDPFPASGSQPHPSGDSPTFFGAASRTIPPLTPDQLARLTQPDTAPGLATSASVTHQIHRPIDNPIDNSSAEPLTAESLTTESLTPEDVEADATIAQHVTPEENPQAVRVTEDATTSAAGSIEPIVAATDTAATNPTDNMAAKEDSTEARVPEQASVMVETDTAQVVIPTFQPVAALASPPESADSIPPFVPNPAPSDFHQRLKAVSAHSRPQPKC